MLFLGQLFAQGRGVNAMFQTKSKWPYNMGFHEWGWFFSFYFPPHSFAFSFLKIWHAHVICYSFPATCFVCVCSLVREVSCYQLGTYYRYSKQGVVSFSSQGGTLEICPLLVLSQICVARHAHFGCPPAASFELWHRVYVSDAGGDVNAALSDAIVVDLCRLCVSPVNGRNWERPA